MFQYLEKTELPASACYRKDRARGWLNIKTVILLDALWISIVPSVGEAISKKSIYFITSFLMVIVCGMLKWPHNHDQVTGLISGLGIIISTIMSLRNYCCISLFPLKQQEFQHDNLMLKWKLWTHLVSFMEIVTDLNISWL